MPEVKAFDLYWVSPGDSPLLMSIGLDEDSLLDEIRQELHDLDIGCELMVKSRYIKTLDIL